MHGGSWPQALGKDFSALQDTREKGDYGAWEHVTADEAKAAIEAAHRILEAVREEHPELE